MAKKYRIYHEDGMDITELKRGERYSVRVQMPPDANHPKWWRSKSRKVQASSKAEAVKAALAYKAELTRSVATGTDLDVTFETYIDTWTQNRMKQGKVQELTIKREETDRRRLVEQLGDVKVREMTPSVVDAAYTRIVDSGASQATLAKCHQLLSRVLDRAVADRLLDHNPTDGLGVSRPRMSEDKKEEQEVSIDQLLDMLRALDKEPIEGKRVALWLGAVTGMRRGEVLALTWEDVDLTTGIITVRHQLGKEGVLKDTKTVTRKIRICAPAHVGTDKTIAYLRRWQTAQQEAVVAYAKKCLAKGDLEGAKLRWSASMPICTNANMTWQGVDNFGRWRRGWYVNHGLAHYTHEEPYVDAAGRARVKRTGYVGPNFHSLRKTQAELSIAQDAARREEASAKVISDLVNSAFEESNT